MSALTSNKLFQEIKIGAMKRQFSGEQLELSNKLANIRMMESQAIDAANEYAQKRLYTTDKDELFNLWLSVDALINRVSKAHL